MNLGEYLIRLLEAYGVEVMFGIPGVHTAEMYRGLAASPIRHIAPRHEQGAGFMADGYARVTGKPGVCLVITGPGLSNIATAMLQAKGDSIPMLVISGVNARGDMGSGRGHLHEMPDQRGFASQCAVASHTILTPDELPGAVARAFAVFESARPGPVHIEIPLDLMTAAADGLPPPSRAPKLSPPVPDNLDEALAAIGAAKAPALLIGGGAKRAGDAAIRLAERLDCPVIATMNARASLPADHPLFIAASPGHGAVHALIEQADLVLAFGTEMGPTDYLDWDTGTEPRPRRLLRVDIDPGQLLRGPRADIALVGDAGASMRLLLDRLGDPVSRGGAERARKTREDIAASLTPDYAAHIALLTALRDAVPDAMMVGDSTQLVYAGNFAFAPGARGEWFNSSSGFGTLGYAIPAALGAKLGDPARPALAIIGDGGAQFTLGELGTIADSGLPVIVLVWNNTGYGEIRNFMVNRQIKPEGVDLTPPDFTLIAQAYGMQAVLADAPEALPEAVAAAVRSGQPTVIEIRGV